MSKIYISGMEMPKNCLVCSGTDSEYGECVLDPEKRCPEDYGQRADWCPLVPTDDVAERKTCHDTGESRVFRCSECGYGVNDIFEDINAPVKLFEALKNWRFCPCCGAQIKEVQTDADR